MTSLSEALPIFDRIITEGDGRFDPIFKDRIGSLRQRIIDRRSLDRDATVVALLGATGSGKSSLFNAIAGSAVAKVNATRPTTRQVQSVSGRDRPELLDHLGVKSRTVLPHLDPNLVLLDLPDIDSTEAAHREIASDMADVVDVLVWVLDPQKYADSVVHDDFIARMSQHADVTLVVLNQIDRVDHADRKRVLADVNALIKRDGLTTKVYATSAHTGEGISELRSAIGSLVSGRNASEKRLAADVRHIGSEIAGASGEKALGVSREGRASIARSVAHVAGVPQVARAAGKSYRYRGGLKINPPVFRTASKLKGDPLTALHLDSGESSVTALRAGSAGIERVANTVREVAQEATDGMHSADRRTVSEIAERQIPAAVDKADRELASMDIRGRTPTWWSVWNLFQWLAFLTALGGLIWLAVLWGLTYLQFDVHAPTYRNFPIPTLLLIGGIILVLAFWLLGRIFIGRGAKRAESRTRKRLTKAIEGEPTEVITATIDREVDAYNSLRESAGRLAKVR